MLSSPSGPRTRRWLEALPAVAAGPLGRTPAGLPVGVQIIGPRFEDDTAITFAELLAEVTGGFLPPLEHL